jgi:hypothetical protein
MNKIDNVIELARLERNKLAEQILSLNPEYSSLNEDEREILKQNILGVIVEVQSKYRLVKAGKATEEQLFDYLELYGEADSFSDTLAREITDLSDREDEALLTSSEIHNKRVEISILTKEVSEYQAYITKTMLKKKKYAFKPEYCDVLLSWMEAVESDEQQKVYDASQVLLPVLSELIRDQHTFKVKLGIGNKPKNPKHEEKYTYAKQYGDKAAGEKFNVTAEAIRQARFKVKKKYSPKDLELIECLRLSEIYWDKINNEHMTNQEMNEKFNELKLLDERIKLLL